MGNVLSEEQSEETFFKEGFNLESPDADKEINYGASVPRCQPKHTEEDEQRRLKQQQQNNNNNNSSPNSNGSESISSNKNNENKLTTDDKQQAAQAQQNNAGKQKLSYIQMARMGYQELVNAIIRPPRADYKVCTRKTPITMSFYTIFSF